MTAFKAPLFIGDSDTGVPSTNNRGWVTAVQEVIITNTARKAQFQVPENTAFAIFDAVVVSAGANTQGTAIRIGTSAAPTAYATISVSAEGQTIAAANKAIVSAATVIAVDATASVAGSAADSIGRIFVRGVYYTRA